MSLLYKYKKPFILFLFCYGIIIAHCYNIYVYLDHTEVPDSKSYMSMAMGDYDVNITHRYRLIIPLAASAVGKPISKIYKSLWPHRANEEWPLRLSFFLINTFLMAVFGVALYYTCIAYGASVFAAIIAILAVLTSRWAGVIGGTPFTDSLYLILVCLVLYAIKVKDVGILIVCILLGPFIKESFIFLAPVILFSGRKVLSLPKQIPLFLISGVLVFAFRYYWDLQLQTESSKSLSNAVEHFENLIVSFNRVFSLRGIGEIFSIWGVFSLILVIGFFPFKKLSQWTSKADLTCLLFFLSGILPAFLSTEVGRMFYLTSPAFAVAISLIISHHDAFASLRKLPFTRSGHKDEEPERSVRSENLV